ncbi:transmembrane protein 136-like [Cimex lectularius]|uniref:TLC domain-containing protein n=1 Tax=Cimex lectularius TaxID=79782 RepID=A0A8I6S4M3_CIMLE|nr:transmembrane protein 136-like [Cimex lectularius]
MNIEELRFKMMLTKDFSIYQPDIIDIYLLLPILGVSLTFSTFFWKSLYILLKYYNKYPQDVVLHICSLLHTMLCVGAICFFGDIHRNVLQTSILNTWTQNSILIFSIGFFIHDFVYWEYEDHRDIVMLLHHVASVISLLYPLITGTHAAVCFVFMWTYESSNVYLHFRYLMKRYGFNKKNERLFNLNEMCFVIAFVTQRFFIGAHFTYLLLVDQKVSNEFIKVMAIILNILSLAFYDAIYIMVRRKHPVTGSLVAKLLGSDLY